jgi:hypothetical protein
MKNLSMTGVFKVAASFSLRPGRNLKVAATPLTECLHEGMVNYCNL